MKKIAVLVEDNYQTLEVWYPYLRLKEENIEPVMVGTGSRKIYRSKVGYPAAEELSIIIHRKSAYKRF
jgi:protease I